MRNNSKYMQNVVKRYGAIRVQIQVIGHNRCQYICWLDSVVDKHDIENCLKGFEELEKFFNRNNYYLDIVKHEDGIGRTFEVAKDIKRWNRVDTRVFEILKHELRFSETMVIRS